MQSQQQIATTLPPVTTADYNQDLIQGIPEEDRVLLQNVVVALESLGSDDFLICKRYKITTIPTGYLVHAKLPSSDVFEINIDDLLFLQSISPSRIENIAIGRAAQGSHNIELFLKVLNHHQRIMIRSSAVTFHSATTSNPKNGEGNNNTSVSILRKRKMEEISSSLTK